jgi:hypothetical protein
MKHQKLMWSGIIAPVFYLTAVILGGALKPDYSHIANFVSELIESGAPNTIILHPLFIFYNIFTGIFAFGLFYVVSGRSKVTDLLNSGNYGAIVLGAEALFGFITIFFPQDPVGTAVTPTGTIHIILAGLSSLTTMGAMLLMVFWFKNIPGLKRLSTYSLVSLVIVFGSGGFAAYTAASGGPIAGLLERVTIGAFLQWMVGIGIVLLREP